MISIKFYIHLAITNSYATNILLIKNYTHTVRRRQQLITKQYKSLLDGYIGIQSDCFISIQNCISLLPFGYLLGKFVDDQKSVPEVFISKLSLRTPISQYALHAVARRWRSLHRQNFITFIAIASSLHRCDKKYTFALKFYLIKNDLLGVTPCRRLEIRTEEIIKYLELNDAYLC